MPLSRGSTSLGFVTALALAGQAGFGEGEDLTFRTHVGPCAQ